MRSSSSEGGARMDGDIDLMIVAESLDCLDPCEALQTADRTLDRFGESEPDPALAARS